jgi:hypothetical protein
MTPHHFLSPNIPAGGTSQAGCAPFARRGGKKGLREALNLNPGGLKPDGNEGRAT